MRMAHFFASLLFCLSCRGNQTNELFLLDDGFLKVNYAQRLKEAADSLEALPAEKFPGGNWGGMMRGFQVSLRLNKSQFFPGEPIVATMLLRNVTNQPLSFIWADVHDRWNGPVFLTVTTTNGQLVSLTTTNPLGGASVQTFILGPWTQSKFEQRIDDKFQFRPNATYLITAQCPLPATNRVYVTSQPVPITISH